MHTSGAPDIGIFMPHHEQQHVCNFFISDRQNVWHKFISRGGALLYTTTAGPSLKPSCRDDYQAGIARL